VDASVPSAREGPPCVRRVARLVMRGVDALIAKMVPAVPASEHPAPLDVSDARHEERPVFMSSCECLL